MVRRRFFFIIIRLNTGQRRMILNRVHFRASGAQTQHTVLTEQIIQFLQRHNIVNVDVHVYTETPDSPPFQAFYKPCLVVGVNWGTEDSLVCLMNFYLIISAHDIRRVVVNELEMEESQTLKVLSKRALQKLDNEFKVLIPLLQQIDLEQVVEPLLEEMELQQGVESLPDDAVVQLANEHMQITTPGTPTLSRIVSRLPTPLQPAPAPAPSPAPAPIMVNVSSTLGGPRGPVVVRRVKRQP